MDITSLNQVAWSLVGRVAESEQARRIPIYGMPFTIGRRSTAVLSIPNQSVSGAHAEIRLDQETLWLHDLCSTNGTFVNGTRVSDPVPLGENDLVQFGQVVFRLERLQAAPMGSTLAQDAGGRAVALIQFDKLIGDGRITPYFQPIVELGSGKAIGFEALARSDIAGMRTPEAMFRAAKALDLERELSAMLRSRGAEIGSSMAPYLGLFLNAHPRESYPELKQSMEKLRLAYPDREMTLEIQCSVSGLNGLQELQLALRDLGVRIAFDDFGAGNERLHELVETPPDYLKFDISVIRGIDTASLERQRMIASLVAIARGVGAESVAEGVETEKEAETCKQLGFKLAQGYLLGRPSPLDACELTIRDDAAHRG